MELLYTYTTKQEFSRKTTLNTNVTEKIYKRSHDSIVDYEVSLQTNSTEIINVYFAKHELLDELSKPLLEGVKEFISFLRNRSISCNGFDIFLKNIVYMPADYKPRNYKTSILYFLKEIFFNQASDIISKPILDYKLNDSTNIDEYQFDEKLKLYRTIDVILGIEILSIPEISIKKNFYDEYTLPILSIIIFPNKKLNINIFIDEQEFKYNDPNWVQRVLEALMKDLAPKYQLPGLDLYISNESALHLESNLIYDLYWFIKELLLRSNNIQNL
jgi:hypothetical protein